MSDTHTGDRCAAAAAAADAADPKRLRRMKSRLDETSTKRLRRGTKKEKEEPEQVALTRTLTLTLTLTLTDETLTRIKSRIWFGGKVSWETFSSYQIDYPGRNRRRLLPSSLVILAPKYAVMSGKTHAPPDLKKYVHLCVCLCVLACGFVLSFMFCLFSFYV